MKLDPGSAYAYDALARVHAAMADYGRSRAALEQAIALQPDFAPWQVDLGALYWAHGFDYAARTAYDRALETGAGLSARAAGQGLGAHLPDAG